MNHNKPIAITLILTLGLFLIIGCFGPFAEDETPENKTLENETGGETEEDGEIDEEDNGGDKIKTYSLNIESTEGGTTEVNPEQDQYEEGTEVTITVEPEEDWIFQEWTGDIEDTDKEITITMTEDKAITANFLEEFSYQINNCQQLQNIENDLNGNYTLNKDIDCSDTKNWNNGKGFNPIGDNGNEFKGTLNGEGNTINNLYINKPDKNNTALIEKTSNNSEIKNIGLKDVDITGNYNVGGLVGENNAKIQNSFVKGTVEGNSYIGGLIGDNDNYSHIENCYSSGSIKGDYYIGGLIGWNNQGTVKNSYSSANVTINTHIEYEDGLIGMNLATEEDIHGTFWDTETSGIEYYGDKEEGIEVLIEEESVGLPTEQMQNKSIFVDAGWDFEDTWYMDEYPNLQWNE